MWSYMQDMVSVFSENHYRYNGYYEENKKLRYWKLVCESFIHFMAKFSNKTIQIVAMYDGVLLNLKYIRISP